LWLHDNALLLNENNPIPLLANCYTEKSLISYYEHDPFKQQVLLIPSYYQIVAH